MWGKLGKYEEIVSYNYLTTFLHLVPHNTTPHENNFPIAMAVHYNRIYFKVPELSAEIISAARQPNPHRKKYLKIFVFTEEKMH